jgi:hypothetical protein
MYYGTDTRAAELLVGCVLAVILHVRPLRLTERGSRNLAVIGVVAQLITIWCWVNLSLTDPIMYRGGFLAFSFVSVAIILCLLNDRGPVAAALSWAPVAAMGRITYGIYLFHWPIYLWLTEERTGLDPWPLFAVRVAVTMVLAILSYHFLEMPVRNRQWSLGTHSLGWAIAPAAACIVLAAYFVSDNREVVTDLAGLGEVAEAAPDLGIAGDGVLDVLVVTDEGGRALTDELVAAAGPELSVTVASPFTCSGIDPLVVPPTCANWHSEWRALTDQVDPDVVLFQVSSWDPAVLASLAGTDDRAEQTAWASETLDNGLDLLTANGAQVVWNQDAVDIADALKRDNDPFHRAMQGLSGSRSDLRRLQSVQDLDAVQQALRLYQRRDPGELPRVLVVGDSTSRTLGYGLEQWGVEEGTATVWSAGTEGCGLANDGVLRDATGREVPLSAPCRPLADEWVKQVEQFDPDLVVISSVRDMQPRKLDDWPSFLGLGDERFDEYLVEELTAVYDTLSAGGARVVFLEVPCLRDEVGALFSADPDSVERFNEILTDEVGDDRPDLRTFDTGEALCPDGEYVDSIDGVESIRPDGVHFSPEGSRWFAYRFGPALLETGLG